MCGIAGILTFDSASTREIGSHVDRMIAALGHRGPDGRGSWSTTTRSGQALVLGHTRLAIIDLTAMGRQPMVRNTSAVVFNGEIYNYRTLRSHLGDGGEAFVTNSDTEVLLAAHQSWGAGCVDRFDGMFAFGLWDARTERLLLARDRFGIKPLYYYRDSRVLVFASEIRALLMSGLVPAALDQASLWHYFGYQTTPTPATLIRDVRMLEPGTVMEVASDGRTSTRTYWDLLTASSAVSVPTTIEAARRQVGDLLQESVLGHLVSDVPVGLFLSGGIDSGAVLSSVAAAGVRPQSFTVSLDEADLDESAPAALLAHHFGADHTGIRLRAADLLDRLPDVVAATDHPSGDAVNTFVVAEAVREQGLKVALSGLGGDEVFGGYSSFRRLGRLASPAARLARTPRAVRRAAAKVVRAAGAGTVATEKAAAVLDGGGSLAEMWPVTRQLFSEVARARMLSARVPASGDAYAPMLARAFGHSDRAGVYAKVSYAESRAYMHDVLLRDADQMSMAHALEVRVPLLDHRLAAFVVALPDRWKVDGRLPKPLLSRALGHPLPPDIAAAPKRGFALPFDAWMRGPLRHYCEHQLGERGLDGRGLLKPGEARRLWSKFVDRAPGVTWGRAWALVALNAWLERRSL